MDDKCPPTIAIAIFVFQKNNIGLLHFGPRINLVGDFLSESQDDTHGSLNKKIVSVLFPPMMDNLVFQHLCASLLVWLQIVSVPATTHCWGSHLVLSEIAVCGVLNQKLYNYFSDNFLLFFACHPLLYSSWLQCYSFWHPGLQASCQGGAELDCLALDGWSRGLW